MTDVRYPFSAVVGQQQLKLALILSAISPGIGGVLIRGEKGTAKSTIVRGLGSLLVDPDDSTSADPSSTRGRVVELPIGATEDRVIGSLDLTAVLRDGRAEFTPGLLARADGGVLYIDEVNLLADHLVDVLLDAAASGRVTIERDGVSHTQAADFVLVGTMNPEEGELRPQLLDRFGLAVDVSAARDVDERVSIVSQRIAFDTDPVGFVAAHAAGEVDLRERIAAARDAVAAVSLPVRELRRIAGVCAHLDVDGLRGDIVVARAASAHAAWRGADEISADDVRVAVELALPHRRRRNPFDDSGLTDEQIDEAMAAGEEAAQSTPDAESDSAGDSSADDGPEGGGPDDAGPDGEGPDGDGPDDGGPDDGGPDGSPGGGVEPDATRAPEDQRSEATQPDRSRSEAAGAATDGEVPAQGDEKAVPGPVPGARFGRTESGAARRVRRLRVSGIGDGDPGRRSPARSRRGQTTHAIAFERGRPVHLFGTVLTAAGRTTDVATIPGVAVTIPDLRSAQRISQEQNLVVFLVDLSGSMTARRRLAAVSEICVDLLRDSYTRRDRVAVISARGADAEVAVPPTKSVDVAVRRLADVRTGGRTPLAEGLVAAHDLIERSRRSDPARRPLLVILTDGRATAGSDPARRAADAADALRRRGVDAVVVDCEQGMIRLGLAGELAARLGAPCLPMEQLSAATLADPRRAA
ncbi:VWA domain-containing protein [Gordonia soli]|uniref:Putative magnesium chelatase n=1 Tax=Gordonia soli NBRC 108243 TaxID=1223545 RepID=M0QL05_9ACTN|nr:VWA domain-containing protein [Gordonia soli]GAC68956.1 putative magnesium chelatase [Gordonia soli NBRC 108243]